MPLSVTELVTRLKYAVEGQVGEQRVVGEIGSCKPAGSGHVYFTLKDSTAQLQCVMYRYQAAMCRVALRDGLQVELSGRATVWEGRGSLQFVVNTVKPAGVGSLQQQFEALKRRLEAEGLFSPARKKPIPAFPRSVGLITSPTGAVIQDMRHRLESRAPWMQAYLLPVQVQGKGAEHGIAEAIRRWNEAERYGLPQVDYLIVARGGGSMEDLWCFNEETLARAIGASRLPIVSAVGHETDFTIADFVADLRAPTPTAAIELTTPDAAVLSQRLDRLSATLQRSLGRAVQTAELRLRVVQQGPLGQPLQTLAPFAQQLDAMEEDLQKAVREKTSAFSARLALLSARTTPHALHSRLAAGRGMLTAAQQHLSSAATNALSRRHAELQILSTRIEAASPHQALERGFALIRTADGRLARNTADLPPGSRVELQLADGSRHATITP